MFQILKLISKSDKYNLNKYKILYDMIILFIQKKTIQTK